MDLEYEFEQKSREVGRELFDEVLGMIKRGDGAKVGDKLHLLAYEFTDKMVPTPTVELWKYVEFFEELWDDVDRDRTLDQAFRQAVFYKASNYVSHEFEKRGSESQLGALNDAYKAAAEAMIAPNPQAKYEAAAATFPKQFKTLGWEPAWPPVEPSLLKILEDNQDPAEPAPQTPAPRLNLVRRPSGPR